MRDSNNYPMKRTNALPVTQPSVAQPSSLAANSRGNTKLARPSRDEIARKAYFIYLDQGCQHGQDMQHWLKAEAQVTAARNPSRLQL